MAPEAWTMLSSKRLQLTFMPVIGPFAKTKSSVEELFLYSVPLTSSFKFNVRTLLLVIKIVRLIHLFPTMSVSPCLFVKADE